MISLKNKWKIFSQILFDPWIFILILAIIAFFIIIVFQKDTLIIRMFTLFISITSGVLGSIAANRWLSLNEEKLIVARGKVAVRSLKLLLGNIYSIDCRAKELLNRICFDAKKKNVNAELIKTYLEEIINRYEVLEEETQSSIENWTDIVPEADIKTQIGVITKLKSEAREKELDLIELRNSYEERQGKSEKETEQLKNDIKEKERELEKLQFELQEKDLPFSSRSKMYYPRHFFDLTNLEIIYECMKCGFKIKGSGPFHTKKCPKCGSFALRIVKDK